MNSFSRFIEFLEHPVFAGLVTTLLGFALLHFTPLIGKSVIITLIAFFASDILYGLVIGGGNGIGFIPIFGNTARNKGHVFIAFFAAILISAYFSAMFADWAFDFLRQYLGKLETELAISFVFTLALFLDLQSKYYRRG